MAVHNHRSGIGKLNLPPYPYDRLGRVRSLAFGSFDRVFDLSVGTPVDPPPNFVPRNLAVSGLERGYPPSVGSSEFRSAGSRWLKTRFEVEVDPKYLAATVGSKEFVTSLPHYLKLANPEKTYVLFPEIAYPSYEMGALLAGCIPYPLGMRDDGSLALEDVPESIVSQTLLMWLNLPSNPTGKCGGMEEAVEWARANRVVLVSDECYCDFYWEGRAESVLQYGDTGVLALHSLSKRSNFAGMRVGFYSGDSELVSFLSEIRKHSGLMVPGPIQATAVAVLGDEDHVQAQRARYFDRLDIFSKALRAVGINASLPQGGFYLWFSAMDSRADLEDGWALAGWLAENAGIIVSPGEFYGEAASKFVRVAMVAPTEAIRLVADRITEAAE